MLTRLFGEFPKYETFKYWFLPINTSPDSWLVVNKENQEPIGQADVHLVALSPEHEELITEVSAEFERFQQRPEFLIYYPVDGVEVVEDMVLTDEYNKKLITVSMIKAARAGKDPDSSVKAALSCVDWLLSTDFYVAPASTQYHDSEPSGLLKHSLRVLNHIIRLRNDAAFNSVNIESAVLVALVHDWCKIGLYEKYMRNVKNEETGKWEQVPSYRHNQKGLPLGHGASSMFFASKFFRLSSEEAVAIRWHMGEYNVASNESSELHLANEAFPLVFLIQFADRLAITKYAN